MARFTLIISVLALSVFLLLSILNTSHRLGPSVYDIWISVNGQPTRCTGFHSTYASNPFETRTHVFTNPTGAIVDGNPVTVIKDQLCRHETRFNEAEILTHIHRNGPVPGVVQSAFHEVNDNTFVRSRRQFRTGLQQLGRSIMSIDNVKALLEALFDILECNVPSLLHWIGTH